MKNFIESVNAGNTVYVNRPLAHALGMKAAVMYNALIGKQLYYEQRNMLDSEGYFYSTIEDMQESTTLTRCQQNKAISVLVNAGLIDFRVGGIHCRRHFRVRDDVALLDKYLRKGEEKSHGSLSETDDIPCEIIAAYSDDNLHSTLQENCSDIYKQNNKTEDNKHNPSILSGGNDGTEISKREEYRCIIHDNIEYDCVPAGDKAKTDELIEIMLDVICAPSDTVRVNGADIPHETVKSRFLKLEGKHIEYVLFALKKNTSDVRNIRAYLITALYNSSTTIDSYYTTQVNHDLYGQ